MASQHRPAPHLKKIVELFDSAVTIANIHAGQPDPKRVIQFYAKSATEIARRGSPLC